MNETKVRAWTPAKGEKFEAVTVGNVTVKIYRRQRVTANRKKTRWIYELADYTSGIRRLRGFTDLTKARKEADRIARQLSSGDATAAGMLNREAASYGRAVELLRPTGTALEVAAGAFAKAFEITGGDTVIEAAQFYARHRADQVQQRAVADAVAELVAAKQARRASTRYVDDLRARLTRFAKSFGADASTITEPDRKDAEGKDTRNRGVDISTITTADMQRWLDGLKLAPQTVKNFRRVCNTLFSFAEARGYIFKGGNPVEDVERIKAKGGDIEIFTPDEITVLLKAASKEFLPFVALGAFAGLRSAEITRVKWGKIDLAGGFITIDADVAKTASRRLVPILPNLAQWLTPYARQSGQVWKGTRKDLLRARAACVKEADTAWKDNACRHSFISYRLADIQNAAQVALEAGNSPQIIFRHYRELVKPDAAKTWFAVAPESPANVVSMKGATA
jgi:integrase